MKRAIQATTRIFDERTQAVVEHSEPAVVVAKRQRTASLGPSSSIQSPEPMTTSDHCALLNQPAEMFSKIVKELTLEDAFNLSLTCKTARVHVNAFRCKLKHDWVDNMFKKIQSEDEKYQNARHLFRIMEAIINKNGLDSMTMFFEWLSETPQKCPNLPISMLFEVVLENWGETRAMILISQLVRLWMHDDVAICLPAFPIRVTSPQEHIDAEHRLLHRFSWLICASLKARTKSFLLSVAFRSLTDLPQTYKLIYLFCAPRVDGFIDVDTFAAIHPDAQELEFGYLVEVFALLLDSWKFNIGFSDREVFMILEDVTTTPIMWSMQNFVRFLLKNVQLCIMSTYLRFSEGYQEDSASIFYYCIRANASTEYLNSVIIGVAQRMSKNLMLRFSSFLVQKSRQVITDTDKNNKARLAMLKKAHRRVTDCLNIVSGDRRNTLTKTP